MQQLNDPLRSVSIVRRHHPASPNSAYASILQRPPPLLQGLLLEDTIRLLGNLDKALTSQAASKLKGASASAAGPASAASGTARGLALRLGRLRGGQMMGSAAGPAGRRTVPAGHADAAAADAREVAVYFTHAATVQLMLKNPLLIPASLAKPMGKTRAAACKEVRRMGFSRKVGGCCCVVHWARSIHLLQLGATEGQQCIHLTSVELLPCATAAAQVKVAMCNSTIPFPTASAMAHLEMERKLKRMVPLARQDVARKAPGRGQREGAATRRGAANSRSLKQEFDCYNGKSFIDYLLRKNAEKAYKAGYGCLSFSCGFPIPPVPILQVSAKIEGCLPWLDFVNGGAPACQKKRSPGISPACAALPPALSAPHPSPLSPRLCMVPSPFPAAAPQLGA